MKFYVINKNWEILVAMTDGVPDCQLLLRPFDCFYNEFMGDKEANLYLFQQYSQRSQGIKSVELKKWEKKIKRLETTEE